MHRILAIGDHQRGHAEVGELRLGDPRIAVEHALQHRGALLRPLGLELAAERRGIVG
jgi:hypothetical protein